MHLWPMQSAVVVYMFCLILRLLRLVESMTRAVISIFGILATVSDILELVVILIL